MRWTSLQFFNKQRVIKERISKVSVLRVMFINIVALSLGPLRRVSLCKFGREERVCMGVFVCLLDGSLF